MVVYRLFGKRKRVWRTDLSQAVLEAERACHDILIEVMRLRAWRYGLNTIKEGLACRHERKN
jgi:hypothetical protein